MISRIQNSRRRATFHLIEWWDNEELTEDQQTVKRIHYAVHYNDEINLGQGSERDYAKALDRIIVDGEDPCDVPNGTAAMKHAQRIIGDATATESEKKREYGLNSTNAED